VIAVPTPLRTGNFFAALLFLPVNLGCSLEEHIWRADFGMVVEFSLSVIDRKRRFPQHRQSPRTRTSGLGKYIPVYAKLTDGAGNVSKTAYLHFELQRITQSVWLRRLVADYIGHT
jgi:hypothetical protein